MAWPRAEILEFNRRILYFFRDVVKNNKCSFNK